MTEPHVGAVIAGRYVLREAGPTDIEGVERWYAEDEILGRDVLVSLLSGPRTVAALDEARRAALVSDPRLARVLDVGRAEEDPYVVAERPQGRTLAEVVATSGPLSGAAARAVVGEVASALAAAERRGVHHLALRPNAVRLAPGKVVVTGLGTDGSMVDDALRGARAHLPADAAGLGRLLQFALTGQEVGDVPVDPASLDAPAGDDVEAHALASVAASLLTTASPALRSASLVSEELTPWGDVVVPVPPVPGPAVPAPGASAPDASAPDASASGASAPGASAPGASPADDAGVGDGAAAPAGADAPTPEDAAHDAHGATDAPGSDAPLGAGLTESADPADADVPDDGADTQLHDPVIDGEPAPAPTGGGTSSGAGSTDAGSTGAETTEAGASGPTGAGSAPGDDTPDAPATPRRTSFRTSLADAPAPPTLPGTPGPPPAAAPVRRTSVLGGAAGSAGAGPGGAAGAAGAAALGAAGGTTSAAAKGAAATGAAGTVAAAGLAGAAAARAAGAGAGAATGAAAGAGAATSGASGAGAGASAATGSALGASSGSAAPVGAAATPGVTTSSAPGVPARTSVRTSGTPVPPAGTGVPAGAVPPGSRPAPPVATWDAIAPQTASQAGSRPSDDLTFEQVVQRPSEFRRFRFNPTAMTLVLGLLLVGVSVMWATDNLGSFRSPFQWGSNARPVDPAAPGEPTTPATTAPPVLPVIVSAQQLDPDGDENEHPEAVNRAIDLDPTTYWYTRTYRSATFAGMNKRGVGLAVTLERAAPVTTIYVTTNSTGGNVEIRATDPGEPDGGELLFEGPVDREMEIELQTPVTAEHVVLWFTELPQSDGQNRAEVRELSLS